MVCCAQGQLLYFDLIYNNGTMCAGAQLNVSLDGDLNDTVVAVDDALAIRARHVYALGCDPLRLLFV